MCKLVVCCALILGPISAAPSDAPTILPSPDVEAHIVVLKSERHLVLYSGPEIVSTYPIGLGFEPVADKVRAGDGATPEGVFHVCVKNPQSRYFLSLGIAYPNEEDAERGLRDGLITQGEHDAIVRAARHGRCPPWDTALGGKIFIHGRGSSADWTLGCVALDDGAMQELFSAVEVGTQVVILP